MQEEQELTGGNLTPSVVRIGDTVRRPPGSGAAAAALLGLEEIGFPWAPRHLGTDEQGRDVLTWIPGVTSSHPAERDERSYAAIGRILRRLHTSTAGTSLAAGAACLVHGDPGPFNAVLRDGLPVALIDWDTARPGDPLTDVGYAAWTWCLLADTRVPIAEQARRLRRFRDGYDGALEGAVLLHAVATQQEAVVSGEGAVAADFLAPPERRSHAERAAAWARAGQQVVDRHRDLFLEVLEASA